MTEYILDIHPAGDGNSVHTLGERLVRCVDCVYAGEPTEGGTVRCSEWSNEDERLMVYTPLAGYCYLGEAE